MFVTLGITSVSMYHVVSYFALADQTLIAVIIAIFWELSAISALLALFIIDDIPKRSLFAVFFTITLIQVLGNSYSAVTYFNEQLALNPAYLDTWIEFLGNPIKSAYVALMRLATTDFTLTNEMIFHKRILSFMVSGLLPIIYLIFMHFLARIFSATQIKEEKQIIEVVKEVPVEKIVEVIKEVPVEKEVVKEVEKIVKVPFFVEREEPQVQQPTQTIEPTKPTEPPKEENKPNVTFNSNFGEYSANQASFNKGIRVISKKK